MTLDHSPPAVQVRPIDLLKRARDIHRETCIVARGDVLPSAYRCGMCEVLDAPAVPQPPAEQAALRDRIAEVLWPLTDWDGDQLNAEAAADAVLAVQPPPVSRADLIAEAIRRVEAERDATDVMVAEYPRYDLKERNAIGAALRVLRRMADEAQPGTEAPAADCNTGPGWYEVISPRATTCIAYVHEDGSLYLPEGDALTHEEFAFAAARGNAHRLIRADEAQQDGAGS
ncbi:hypothetical protein [Streptomyces sp. NPDC029554]|uniref:hypothetical protein n=1 Tax=Streptomyces sp. NPDC029554 TaxID=3155126 RepID=UPI0033D8DE0C